MTARLRLLVLCAAACLMAGAVVAEEKTSRPIAGWGTLTDPSGDCKVKEEKGKLTLTVPGGTHDLNAAIGGMQAPRVLREVEGDFAVRVKVTADFEPGDTAANPATRPFNGAGLLVWQNDKNYLRLERNAFWVAEQGALGYLPPLVEYYRDGEYQGTNPNPNGTFDEFFKGRTTWLWVGRRGDKVTASYSHDGKKWTAAKQITVEFPKKVQVGVAAVNTSAKPFTVEFEDLKITKE